MLCIFIVANLYSFNHVKRRINLRVEGKINMCFPQSQVTKPDPYRQGREKMDLHKEAIGELNGISLSRVARTSVLLVAIVIYIYLMCTHECLHACIYVCHMHVLCPQRPELEL